MKGSVLMIKVHFLNVGHGDCCIVEFPSSRVAVIDINTTSEMDEESKNEILQQMGGSIYHVQRGLGLLPFSEALARAGYDIKLTDPIEYSTSMNLSSVFRFISTHSHMDHLTGLSALRQQVSIANFWVVQNEFEPNLSELTEAQQEDWRIYKLFRDSKTLRVDNTTVIGPKEGESRDYWNQDGITILAPNADLLEKAKTSGNPNHLSYVLLISYGQTKIILGGDAEEPTWKYLAEKYEDLIAGITILKASHHGRDSGYYQPAVKIMSPQYTIVSVGKKPETDASNKYKTYCNNVFSTRWKGTMTFECYENGDVVFLSEYER